MIAVMRVVGERILLGTMFIFFFQAEDGIRDLTVTGVQTCALPICFRRFPSWMWRNTVVLEFVEWMREFNRDIDPKRAPVGFYGMDLYSLHASIEEIGRASCRERV